MVRKLRSQITPKKTKKTANGKSQSHHSNSVKQNDENYISAIEETALEPLFITEEDMASPKPQPKPPALDLSSLLSSLEEARKENEFFAQAKINFNIADYYRLEALQQKSIDLKMIEYIELNIQYLNTAEQCLNEKLDANSPEHDAELKEIREWAQIIKNNSKKTLQELFVKQEAQYQTLTQGREEAKLRLGKDWYVPRRELSRKAKEFQACQRDFAKISQLKYEAEKLCLSPLLEGTLQDKKSRSKFLDFTKIRQETRTSLRARIGIGFFNPGEFGQRRGSSGSLLLEERAIKKYERIGAGRF